MKKRYARNNSNRGCVFLLTFLTNQRKLFLKATILDQEIHCHRILPYISLSFRTITWEKQESVPVHRCDVVLATNRRTWGVGMISVMLPIFLHHFQE